MNRKILSAICVFSLLSQTAFAAPINSIEQNTENGNIVVSGDFLKSGRFSVQLLKPGTDVNSLINASDEELFEAIEAIVNSSTEDGKYTVELPMSSDAVNGAYIIGVNSDHMGKVERKIFDWYNIEEINKLFNQIKMASADTLLALIDDEENCKMLGTSYNLVKNIASTELVAIVSDFETKISDSTTLDDYRKEFVKAFAPKAISSAKTDDEAKELLIDNAQKLELAENEKYIEFGQLDETIQNAVMNRVRGEALSDTDDIISVLEKALFLEEIRNAASVTDVNKAIKSNKKLFSSAMDNYFAVTNTYNYDKDIKGKNYDSIADFEEGVKGIMNSGSSSGNGGSSGGSGNNLITMPQANVSADVSIFNDLVSAEWARVAIEALAEKGIVSGRGDKRYCPDDYVTREEFVKMLVGAFEISADGDVPFADVSKDAWYYNYIRAAYNSGMVNGISDNMFGTGANITRQDMAVLVYRFLKKDIELPTDGILGFDDKIEISEYAREAIGALRETGIVSGVGENMYVPKDNCTRAQVAYIIYKALKYSGKM